MRFDRKIKTRSIQRLELTDFLGVDFSSSTLDVSNRRASSARNFINIDGVNAKRNGWEEIYKLPGKINGIHTFKVDGDDTTIVYAGKKFYRVSKFLGTVTSFPTNVVGGEVCYKSSYYYLYVSAYNYWEKLSGNFIKCGDYICNDITDSGTDTYPSNTSSSLNVPANQVIQANLTETRSTAFINDNKIWIIGCGDYLVYGNVESGIHPKHQLRRVENNYYTYIPTTTIGIRPNELEDTSRKSLDGINMLSSTRKNKMLGAEWQYELTEDERFIPGKPYYRKSGDNYYLSNYLIESSYSSYTSVNNYVGRYVNLSFVDNVTIPHDTATLVTNDNKNSLGITPGTTPCYAQIGNNNYLIPSGSEYYESLFTFIVDSGKIDSSTTINIEIITDNHLKEAWQGNVLVLVPATGPLKLQAGSSSSELRTDENIGTIYGVVDRTNGKITLYNNGYYDIVPVGEGETAEDNIEVTFKCTNSNLTNSVIKCTIATAFGYGAFSDRLFLSGNSKHPNIDFHSEIDDFTYFPEENTTSFGTAASAIKAYSRLGDGTLAVIKEVNSKEPSIYFRTASIYEESDGTSRTIFPVQAGALGEGAISSWTAANLSGDNLFLSNNGVYGIVLSDNIVTNERYARERSKYINVKLLKENLSEAVGIVYKNKYFLAIEDAENETGNCYILDARYKSASKDSMDDTFNYECWFWDNIPARVWSIDKDKLYFGTSDGRVCVFSENFFDMKYEDISAGNLTIDFSNNAVTINTDLIPKLRQNRAFKFNTDVYSKIIDVQSNSNSSTTKIISGNKIITSSDEILRIAGFAAKGSRIFVDSISNLSTSGIAVSTEYRISDVDIGDCTFKLKDLSGSYITLALNTTFRICENIKNDELYVSEIGTTTFKLSNQFNHEEVLDLVLYNNGSDISANTIAQIILKDNIVYEWYSPILDLGLNDYSKELESLTIVLDPMYKGMVQFGYETKIVTSLLESKQIQNTSNEVKSRYFSFDDLDFNDFSFDNSVASSFTKKVRVRNFNYIMFKFKSDDANGAAVHSIGLTYKIYKKNRGVR